MLRYQDLKPELTARFPDAQVMTRTLAAAGLCMVLAGCSADFSRSDTPLLGLNGEPNSEQRIAVAPQSPDTEPSASTAVQPPAPAVAVLNSETAVTPGIDRREVSDKPRIAAVSTETPSASDYSAVTTGALQSRPAGSGDITVQAGDTLYQLARRHGVSVDALRQANGLTNHIIRPGQVLVLPGREAARSVATVRPARRPRRQRVRPVASASQYVVQPGDSLYAISRRTGVSVAVLQDINGISDVRTLRPGTTLELSRREQAVTAAAPSRTREASLRPTIRPAAPQGVAVKAPPVQQSSVPSRADEPRTPQRPRILNQRPTTPIATKPKQQRQAAIQPVAPAATPSKAMFAWPAKGRIIAPFNHSGQGVKNDGINIALDMGTDIRAADAGVVAYAGSELKGYGNLVLLRHDNGWVSAYAHASTIMVKRGDRVERGQVIAKVGRSGGVSQPQLHFELRQGAKPVDPMPHLASL